MMVNENKAVSKCWRLGCSISSRDQVKHLSLPKVANSPYHHPQVNMLVSNAENTNFNLTIKYKDLGFLTLNLKVAALNNSEYHSRGYHKLMAAHD